MMHHFAFLTQFLDIIADPNPSLSAGAIAILLTAVISVVAIVSVVAILIHHRKNIRKDDEDAVS